MSPSARSRKHLESLGYLVETVEKVYPRTWIKKDLWGFDLAAAKPGEFMLVQVTDDSNHAHRRAKIAALASTPVLKAGPVKLLIHSWGMKGGRGQKKVMSLREEVL